MVEDILATLPLQQTLLRRALAARDPGRLPLRFEGAVADAYRGASGFELVRTRTVGRISAGRRWSVDVGIAPDGSLHLPFGDFVDRVPEEEWPRWLDHLVAEPLSSSFLQMRMSAAACIDDGDTTAWE